MGKSGSIYIIIFLLLAVIPSRGQTYFTTTEFGASGGCSQYFGDLNDRYGFKTINAAYGGYLRKRFNSYIAVKGTVNYTTVGYNDQLNTDPYQKLRNLNFQSNIFEVTAQAEFNFFRFITGDRYFRFTPYLTGGVGLFYYNPTTTYRGVKYNLREQGTEGQNAGYNNRKYSNLSPCFPIGAGVKYWVHAGVNLTLEVADRLTTTDYLDDVSTTYVGADKFPKVSLSKPGGALQDRSTDVDPSNPLGRAGKQRGNASSYDQYIMLLFGVSINFTTYRCPASMNRDMISTY